MSLGRVFQKVEAATENERRPTVDRRYERVDFFGTLCVLLLFTGPGVTYYLDEVCIVV